VDEFGGGGGGKGWVVNLQVLEGAPSTTRGHFSIEKKYVNFSLFFWYHILLNTTFYDDYEYNIVFINIHYSTLIRAVRTFSSSSK
jgi:hypothetical protein